MRNLLLTLALFVSLSVHAEQVPPDAAPRSQGPGVSVPMLAGGTALAYVSYGSSLGTAVIYGALVVPFIAAFHYRIPTDPFYLMIPVAGPFLLAGTDTVQREIKLRNLLWFDGGVQILATALIVGSFLGSSAPSQDRYQLLALPNYAGLQARF